MRDHNRYRGVLSRFIAAPGRIRIDFFASVAQEMYSKTHLSTYVNHDIDDDEYKSSIAKDLIVSFPRAPADSALVNSH